MAGGAKKKGAKTMYDIERIKRGEVKDSKRKMKDKDEIDMNIIKTMSLGALMAQNEEERK